MEKGSNKRKGKDPGGYVQTLGHLLPPSACSDRAVAPPLALIIPVQPEPSRARIMSPASPLSLCPAPRFLSLSLSPARANPSDADSVLELRLAIARVPRRR